MKKTASIFAICLLSLLFISLPISSDWRYNPYTQKLDFYQGPNTSPTYLSVHLIDNTTIAYDLILDSDSDTTILTADRTLIFDVNNADRVFDLQGNLTVEATSIVNQDLSTDATAVTFSTLSLSGTSNQIILQSAGITGTLTATPAASNKVWTLQNVTGTIYQTGGTDVTVADGGIGLSVYAIGDLIYASATTTLARLADVAVNQVLVSGGVGVAPAYSATPTLTSVTVGNTGLIVGSSTPFSDSSGTLTLQNIDAIDATTEGVIEAAIDTLDNLTSIMSGAGSNVTVFGSATSGKTPEVTINGFRTGDSLRQLEIGVGVDAADSASLDGVSNILIDSNVMIGALTAPGGKLEVKDGDFYLSDTDVAHGMTDVVPTVVYGVFEVINATRGGLLIQGLSDTSSADARSLALRGLSNDTHTDTVPLVEIIGAKRSDATIQALAAAEIVLQIANHSTGLVNVLGSGTVLIGHTASTGRLGQNLELHQTANYGGMSLNTWSTTNAQAGLLDFTKSASATKGTHVVVADDEALGTISFRGSDGVEFLDAAYIKGEVDATVTGSGTDDMPGRLIFATTADGAGSATERVRIDNAGLATFYGAITSGSDGTGYDITHYSDTASSSWLWDTSEDGVVQATVFGNTTGNETAHSITVTDATTASQDMHRGFVVAYTSSGAKTGSSYIAGINVDVTLSDANSGATTQAYGIASYITPSGTPTIGTVVGLETYMEDMGSSPGILIGVDIGINSTNVATGRHTGIRVRNHSGVAKDVLLVESAFVRGINLSGATFSTADIVLQNSETIKNTTDGTIEIDGILKVPGYTRHHDVPIGAASLGPTAPSVEKTGTVIGLGFDADAEEIGIVVEIPSEWDGASNMTLNIQWHSESGDAIANAETVIWDVQWRSIAAGESVENGTVASGTVTYTEAGNPGTTTEFIKSTITIAYTGGNQPLTVGDLFFLRLDRDVTGDDYSGKAIITKIELEYTANALGSH